MAVVRDLCRSLVSNISFKNEFTRTYRLYSSLQSYGGIGSSKNERMNCVNSVGLTSFSSLDISRYASTNAGKTKEVSAAFSMAQEILAAKMEEEKRSSNENKSEGEDDEKRQKETENQRTALKFSFIAFGSITIFCVGSLIYVWGAPIEDESGNELKDQFSHLPLVEQYLNRTYMELGEMRKSIKEPSREKLLPDTLSGSYVQPPYTLVLELKDVLVHPEWTYSNGWRFKIRPGLEYFLNHCAPPLFEIVIYTQEQGMTAHHVLDKLDTNGYIWYRLYRDSTHYIDGKHVKELTRLNRDLKKVIMVDWNKDVVSCHRNHLKVPQWDGNMNDKGLVQLGDFLRTIAENEVDDVREVLDYYHQFEDPLVAYDSLKKETQLNEKVKTEKEKEMELNDVYKLPKAWKPTLW